MEDLQVEDFNDPIEHKESRQQTVLRHRKIRRMMRNKPPFSKRS